jgi:hypothetical protein
MTMPQSPLTALAQGAAAHHELYLSWVNAGFTPDQAMDLLKVFFAYGLSKGDAQ